MFDTVVRTETIRTGMDPISWTNIKTLIRFNKILRNIAIFYLKHVDNIDVLYYRDEELDPEDIVFRYDIDEVNQLFKCVIDDLNFNTYRINITFETVMKPYENLEKIRNERYQQYIDDEKRKLEAEKYHFLANIEYLMRSYKEEYKNKYDEELNIPDILERISNGRT